MEPRGIRNNNPLNIRLNPANKWVGRVEPNTDGAFEQFTEMKYGYRAAFLLLHKYMTVYNCRCIRAIVHRWCPKGDGSNNPDSYTNKVAFIANYPATRLVRFEDMHLMCAIADAMTYIECGKRVERDIVMAGYKEACMASNGKE